MNINSYIRVYATSNLDRRIAKGLLATSPFNLQKSFASSWDIIAVGIAFLNESTTRGWIYLFIFLFFCVSLATIYAFEKSSQKHAKQIY